MQNFTDKNLLPFKGEVYFNPHLFSEKESDLFFDDLLNNIQWKQMPIKIFGKEIMQPRLTAWFADKGLSYSYSGLTLAAFEWTDPLLLIKQRVEKISGCKFNSALLNLYRNGNDSMGWHRDNEKELGMHPVIGSVSFGAPRKFQLRDHKTKDNTLSIELNHGSFLLMRGETQPNWEHRIPKETKVDRERINITFRTII